MPTRGETEGHTPDQAAEQPGDLTRSVGEDPLPDRAPPNKTHVEQLGQAIGALPLHERETLLWSYFENWSAERIAEQLGVPVAEVATLRRRALVLLRAQLSAGPGLVAGDPGSNGARGQGVIVDSRSESELDDEQEEQ